MSVYFFLVEKIYSIYSGTLFVHSILLAPYTAVEEMKTKSTRLKRLKINYVRFNSIKGEGSRIKKLKF